MSTPSLHIAIIPDGNRRWAKKRGMLPWKGHEKSAKNFENLLNWSREDPRIGTFTIWTFSTENWKRDRMEVKKLMSMFEKYLIKERKTFQEKKTRFVHSGRIDRLPASLRKLIADITEETKEFTDFTLNVALDYGGKDEIIRAINKLSSDSATEETLRSSLDHPELPDIDLIVRTSGEKRTSNFFLWQSTYAEWIFADKYFPDFDVPDLKEALVEYAERKRRFGK